jgi:hypothetical protein
MKYTIIEIIAIRMFNKSANLLNESERSQVLNYYWDYN